MDYRNKYLMFMELINITFSTYKKEFYSIDKTFFVKFILPDREIKLPILPDSTWCDFKKQIEKNIFGDSVMECQICFYQKVHVKDCERCLFTICDDCISEITLTDNVYRCPQCRYIPPHVINPNPLQPKPRFSKLDDKYWVVTGGPPSEEYLSTLSDDYSYFYVTDDSREEMKALYGSHGSYEFTDFVLCF